MTDRPTTLGAPAAALVALLLAALAAGCDGPAARSPARPVVPRGAGSIVGVVRLLGPAPVMKPLPGAGCAEMRDPILDESVLADADGGLANVIVYVKDAPNVAPAPGESGAPRVVMDQRHCRFEPHVVAVRTGQVLRFRSDDATLHNVRGQCQASAPFNLAMASAGSTRDVTLSEPEIFQVRCDVHPWMNAWVGVFDNPVHAVTGRDGAFELSGLPPGQWTVVAWHERLGTASAVVNVAAGATKVNLAFH